MSSPNAKNLLAVASINMQNVFASTFKKIYDKLTDSLDYTKNPEFSNESMSLLYKFVEGEIKTLGVNIKDRTPDQIIYCYYVAYTMQLIAYYKSANIPYTYDSVMKQVPTLVDKKITTKISDVTVQDLLQIINNTEYTTKKLIQDTLSKHMSITNMKNTGRTDLADIMAQNLQGKKLQQTIYSNMTAIVDKANRRWNVDTYVDVVVQTKANTAYVSGLQDFASEHDGSGDLALIPYNKSTIDACLDYEGETISMTGATDGYRTYDELFDTFEIFHPHCHHHPIPISDPNNYDESQFPDDLD
jgi:hypothetical protein